jgi:hypothetical protein
MLNRPAATLSSIETLVDMQKDPVLAGCIERVQAGFKHAHLPTLTSDGTSGTYILQDRKGDPVAVFKPMDEEPFAPNNPRGMCGLLGSETTRPGVRSGEQAAREAIAYLLDHESFADVPATSLVRLSHPAFEFKGGKNSNPTDKFKFVQVASFLETSSDSTCDSEIKHTLLNLSTSAGKVGSL